MSESETMGRCRREIDKCLSRNDLFHSQAMLADAIDRIAADVAEIKARVDSVEPEDVPHFVESKKALLALVEEQRDSARYALADAQAEVERLLHELAEAKADSYAREDSGKFIPSEREWNELVDRKTAAIRERNEARAEVERLKAELTAAKAETQRIQDEADDREQTEKVKRLNAEIEKTHRTLLNRTWERDIATAEVERLRQSWMLTNVLARAGSPPVVEVPALTFLGSMTGREQGIVLAYRDALDAAGIPWKEKEVPRD